MCVCNMVYLETLGTFLFHFEGLYIHSIGHHNETWHFCLRKTKVHGELGLYLFSEVYKTLRTTEVRAVLTNQSAQLLSQSLWDIYECTREKVGQAVAFPQYGLIVSTPHSILLYSMEWKSKWILKKSKKKLVYISTLQSIVVRDNTANAYSWIFKSNSELELSLEHSIQTRLQVVSDRIMV